MMRSPYLKVSTGSVTLARSSRREYSAVKVHDRPQPHRPRLSDFWAPSTGLIGGDKTEARSLLSKAGYLRFSHAGIFHLLPLGQRVQDKLERLVDKHMQHVGASKMTLSSISSQALWQQSGRLEGYGQELFRLSDRKGAPYLLAPTHEEEITNLVGSSVKSYRDLPIRLYQISRKYRDELRPRHGLLRAREFVMKDLYTFDATVEAALETYTQVRAAYSRLFNDLKLPCLVAEASSGDMGGDLSHEYHLPSASGEDTVISCDTCDYVANEELAECRSSSAEDATEAGGGRVWRGISKDRSTLVNVWYPASASHSDVNSYAVKSIVSDLDSSVENVAPLWAPVAAAEQPARRQRLLNIIDHRLGPHFTGKILPVELLPTGSGLELGSLSCDFISTCKAGQGLNMLRVRDGDSCARCSDGKLRLQKAVELGHTFHLGTRYSAPLGATVQMADNNKAAMQMGCHGIGLSRIMGAVAESRTDDRGLNWPRVIAPFEVVVIPGPKATLADAESIYDRLTRAPSPYVPAEAAPDVVLDDRSHQSFGWKMKDADAAGYPIIVVLGRGWAKERTCEVQCRSLSIHHHADLDELPVYVANLLARLG